MYIYISVISVIFVLNFVGFFLAYFFKTDKFTDISYSLSFICALGALFSFMEDISITTMILFGMVTAWSVRLGTYLLRRIHQMGRDKRFDEMRDSIMKFGSFWFLQAITVVILMLPIVYLVSIGPIDIGHIQIIAFAIFLIGFLVEWVADYQKSRFKAEHPDQLFTYGLYGMVRYPNYLGEVLVWLGIWLFGITYYTPMAILTIISPIWIFLLLRYVSGIPLVESKRAQRYKGDEAYAQYVDQTPLLIPNPSRIFFQKDKLLFRS